FGCPHALGARQGLQWKARRICFGKSEDLERKARFFAAESRKKGAIMEKKQVFPLRAKTLIRAA
ncbi:MAG: hypothetical protein LBK13_01390, partial [Spirochaetales bacterium]|nr:hypothetical protein [Spirochaetales bacterium]